jgi:ferritin-like metal-binding protein YciE
MEGVIQEGAEVLDEKGDRTILDLGLIGAGTRVEHYEMAGYMTAINLANKMEEGDVARLLKQTLSEEEAADKKLRLIATSLMKNVAVEVRQETT